MYATSYKNGCEEDCVTKFNHMTPSSKTIEVPNNVKHSILLPQLPFVNINF